MFEMGQAEIDAVTKVIKSGNFMRYRGGEGGFTENFEKELGEQFGVRHVLTVNSGTSALICGLAAMGIGPGDEVIVPAYTWVASAMAVLAVGAVPVMADIDESLTLNPQSIERHITPYTKAIIPVHMVNLPCDMDAIRAVAEKHHLLICEDACQACGVSYKGKRVGTLGQVGALSFNMFKNITCGEGGAVLTNDDRYYERALMYHDAGCFTRNHAAAMKEPFFPGVNYRVSEISGAIIYEQRKRLDPGLDGLKKNRRTMAEVLSKAKHFRIAPHHDENSAVTLALIFPDAAAAQTFCAKHGCHPLIESGRHVYTNWEPLLEQRAFHPLMNPFNWTHRKIDYTPEMCQDTLRILERAIVVAMPWNESTEKARARDEELLD